MARKSLIVRNEKRLALSKKYAKKRAELKEKGDWEGLQKLPRNASPVRFRNRCFITGRPRGYIRSFGMSRISVREQVSKGYIPRTEEIIMVTDTIADLIIRIKNAGAVKRNQVEAPYSRTGNSIAQKLRVTKYLDTVETVGHGSGKRS